MGIASAGLEHKVSSVQEETRRSSRTGLDALFLPDSVALIGPPSVRARSAELFSRISGTPLLKDEVYAVNSRHSEICGLKAYPSIGEIPGKVDLAVVATPAPTVPQIIGECVDAGVKSAIVISAGFKERGSAGCRT